jgi:hypothetical protein
VDHSAYNARANVTLEAYAIQELPSLGLAGNINFGDQKVGVVIDTTIERFYVNGGLAPLHVDEAVIVGPDRFDFEITGGTGPFDLDGTGDGRPVTIRFAPQTPGQKEAWLHVRSNSSTGELDSIRLRGDVRTGPLLQMTIPDLLINFGERKKGRPYDTTFSSFFYNAGTDTLVFEGYKAGPDPDAFNFLAPINELAPGEVIDFGITLFGDPSLEDGWRRSYLVILVPDREKLDTIQMIANFQGVSSVPTGGDDADEAFSITPNPTPGNADVHVMPQDGEVGQQYTLRVIDVTGREVDRQTGRFGADGLTYQFRRGDRPTGVYYISVQTDTGMRVRTVTVAR